MKPHSNDAIQHFNLNILFLLVLRTLCGGAARHDPAPSSPAQHRVLRAALSRVRNINDHAALAIPIC
eukprot:47560-Eustigmatos_ZCMA.PRE.1